MKNKSWKYPFSRIGDKRFDGNKDGELDSTETFFRDMHINEMRRKEEARKQQNRAQYNSFSGSDSSKVPPLSCSLLILAILGIGFALVVSVESDLVRFLIWAGSAGLAVLIFRGFS